MTKKYEVDSMLGDYYVKCGGSILFWGSRDKCNKVCDLLNEQDTTIKRLKEIRGEQIQTILKQKRKIKELTAQLKTDEEDDICIKCKHHYLINYPESSKYYISKCKKEHEECSKEYIRFCEDFELDGDVE